MNAVLRGLAASSFLVICLSGCATLEVTVAILDKQSLPIEQKVESNAWLEATRYAREAEQAYYATLQRIAVEDVNAILGELLQPLTPAETAAGARQVVTSAVQRAQIQADIHKSAAEQLSAARAEGEWGLRSYQDARHAAGAERATGMRQALEQLIRNRQLVDLFVKTLQRDLEVYIEQFVNRTVPVRASAARESVRKAVDNVLAATRARPTMFGGATLFADPLAAWVVSSPKEAWSGHINSTYGGGYLGNVDIAVKLEGEGTFTLKGVRLDAAKTTAATFAVMRQAVNVFAGGIPLPSTATGTKPISTTTPTSTATDSGGLVTPDASRDLLDAAQDIRDSERQQREQAQFALSAMFDTVVRNRRGLEDQTPAVRAAAISEVRVIYNAHKSMLAAPKKGESP